MFAVYTDSSLLVVLVSIYVCVEVSELSLTENKNSMTKRLSPVWLHCDIQHGGISPNDADSVVLLRLSEHPQQLIGYDPVEHRYGNHGNHEGQKCIHLFRDERQRDGKTLVRFES